MKLVGVITLAALASASLVAEHAIVGTWKQNRAKVERTTDSKVISIESTRNGLTIRSAVGKWFTASFDGKETPMALNPSDTVKLKRLGDGAIEWTVINGGKPRQTTRWDVSPDRTSMTATSKTYVGDAGEENAVVSTYKRVDGTGKPNPFDGSWEVDPRLTKYAKEDVFTATQRGDLLTIAEPNAGIETAIDLKTGQGKMSGPAAPSDAKFEGRVIDNRTLEIKMSRGNWLGTSLFSVSADNKILTQRDRFKAAEGKEVETVLVYERQ